MKKKKNKETDQACFANPGKKLLLLKICRMQLHEEEEEVQLHEEEEEEGNRNAQKGNWILCKTLSPCAGTSGSKENYCDFWIAYWLVCGAT